MMRLGLGVAIATLAFGSISHASTNLFVNGSLEDNNGFNEFGGTGDAFTTGFNFAGFQGWLGWASDFNDNGTRDDSYDTGTPGGFMFFNLFPAGPLEGNNSQPTLTGIASMIALGPFDGNTTSFAWQQVAVTPGDTYRSTVWSRIDSTALNGEGNPEPTIFDSAENQAFHAVDFIDPLTGEADIFLPSPDEDTIFDAATQTLAEVDQMWVESVFEVTAPAGASIFRQTIGFNQFNNEPGVAFFDTFSMVNLSDGTILEGDLDYDGELTDFDVQMLQLGVDGELAPVSIDRFDLSDNGVIDQADLDILNGLIGPAFQADFNGDGTVDLLDLDILGVNFGMAGTPSTGDANGDNVVDLLDLDILGSEFGQGGTSSAVPEPTAALMVALGVAPLFGRRR